MRCEADRDVQCGQLRVVFSIINSIWLNTDCCVISLARYGARALDSKLHRGTI